MNTAQENLDSLLLMNFGYVSAADLILWCDQQLIMSALNRSPSSVSKAVKAAISIIQDRLRNVYDLSQELTRQDTVAPAATADIDDDGTIIATDIVGVGNNFYTAPTITVTSSDGHAPDSVATLIAEISGSTLSALELLRGGGHYKTAPAISFVGGGGTGAEATCTIDKFGRVNAITLVNPGSGWQSIPQIVFTSADGFGIGAAAAAQIAYGTLTSIAINNAGSGYTAAPILTIEGGQVQDSRHPKLVVVVSINAIRCMMGNAENISDVMGANYKMADAMIEDLRAGLDSLPLFGAAKQIRSNTGLIQDNFRQLG